MNVFLPYPDYATSVLVLDNQRLGKQRSEVKAVHAMCVAAAQDGRFQTQPIVRMWRGSLWWLMEYGKLCCDEWTKRGFDDNLKPFFEFVQRGLPKGQKPRFPEVYHSSVRANLLRKDREFYGRYGWTEMPAEGYAWPAPPKEVA